MWSPPGWLLRAPLIQSLKNRGSERVRDMSDPQRLGWEPWSPAHFGSGVSWMGWLTVEPGRSLPHLWPGCGLPPSFLLSYRGGFVVAQLSPAYRGPGHFLDHAVRPDLDLGLRIAASSPFSETCFPIIRGPKLPGGRGDDLSYSKLHDPRKTMTPKLP